MGNDILFEQDIMNLDDWFSRGQAADRIAMKPTVRSRSWFLENFT